MEFTASSGGDGGSYEKPKPGSYYGVLVGFADIGTHTGQYGAKRKVMLRWELHRRKGPSLDSGGNIHTITARYNRSFDAKSSLRPVIEAHVGPIRDGEKSDSRDWLGASARLVLRPSVDEKYINVDAVAPLDPEEDERPRRVEPTVHWEGAQDGPPPQWCKHAVENSAEWQDRAGERNPAAVAVAAGAVADDDDIPF